MPTHPVGSAHTSGTSNSPRWARTAPGVGDTRVPNQPLLPTSIAAASKPRESPAPAQPPPQTRQRTKAAHSSASPPCPRPPLQPPPRQPPGLWYALPAISTRGYLMGRGAGPGGSVWAGAGVAQSGARRWASPEAEGEWQAAPRRVRGWGWGWGWCTSWWLPGVVWLHFGRAQSNGKVWVRPQSTPKESRAGRGAGFGFSGVCGRRAEHPRPPRAAQKGQGPQPPSPAVTFKATSPARKK